MAKGYKEYQRFMKGDPLTYRQAVLAQCYVCNGMDEGGDDCKGISCPLYQHMSYRTGKTKRPVSEEVRQRLVKQLKKARKPLKLPPQDAEIL